MVGNLLLSSLRGCRRGRRVIEHHRWNYATNIHKRMYRKFAVKEMETPNEQIDAALNSLLWISVQVGG
uniref:Uncharacterized protein n=1 Tax=Chelonoidis abingdonii TaxID=106734 RepID=A0A8C0QSM9_CHEAB